MPSLEPATPHLLIAGAGGLGCPAALAAVQAGARVTLVDPDVVDASNLPRQVLYSEEHVGQPKAAVAVRVLEALVPGAQVAGHVGRVDADTLDTLLLGDGTPVDVVIDATDGAHAKDWLNHAAVVRGLRFVHAAGIRSEGRLMSLAPGGRPCLACLFGRLQEETGSCADLGVWNGVVGQIGVRAVAAALGAAPTAITYEVHDFADHRCLPLAVTPDPACPVCVSAATNLESYPAPFACAVPTARETDTPASHALPEHDLREEQCPMNLLRARQAVEAVAPGSELAFRLGAEGAATVPDGLREQGHEIVSETTEGEGLRIVVRVGSSFQGPQLVSADLERFARQVVLPEFGTAGQQRLFRARVSLRGPWRDAVWAALYLLGAGVGHVLLESRAPDPDTLLRAFDFLEARARGTLLYVDGVDADLEAAVGETLLAPVEQGPWRGIDLAHRVQRHVVLNEGG